MIAATNHAVTPGEPGEPAMARVVNQVHIDGPIESVFDFVTTARHWPKWHPATLAVGGVTERPFGPGDTIHERAQIGARVYEGDWTVVEYARPSRVVLRIRGGHIRITYSLTADAGTTRFRREVAYRPEHYRDSVADPEMLECLMDRQSARALGRLKELVEARPAAGAGKGA